MTEIQEQSLVDQLNAMQQVVNDLLADVYMLRERVKRLEQKTVGLNHIGSSNWDT